MEFSDNILSYFQENNIKPTQVATQIGINKSTFSRWKKNPTSKIDLDIVFKISIYLDVSIDYLLTGIEKSSSAKLTDNEQELLKIYNNIDETGKNVLLACAHGLSISNAQNITPDTQNKTDKSPSSSEKTA